MAEPMTLLHSLQTRLTASFVVLILTISSLAFGLTYRAAQQSLKEATQDELRALAAVSSVQLSGLAADSLAHLSAGDEETQYFVTFRHMLQQIQHAHEDIVYVYTLRRIEDGVAFVVDADYGNPDDPGAAIDEIYEPDDLGRLLDGFSGTAVDDEFRVDRWGTFLSGYAPVRDSAGQVVAIVAVDIASDRVIEKQKIIGSTIFIAMGGGILVAGLMIFAFSRTVVRDIRKLNYTANTISMGQMDVDLDVDRKDEIGELATSFGRMVASLKIMMTMSDTEHRS